MKEWTEKDPGKKEVKKVVAGVVVAGEEEGRGFNRFGKLKVSAEPKKKEEDKTYLLQIPDAIHYRCATSHVV